jgi:hypothetical protein
MSFCDCYVNKCVKYRYINDTLLTGGIPSTFQSLAKLQILEITNSDLWDALPDNLGYLPSLQRLDLKNNRIGNSIPESLGTLRTLQVMDVSNNNMTGSLPESLERRDTGVVLMADGNCLQEKVPGRLLKNQRLNCIPGNVGGNATPTSTAGQSASKATARAGGECKEFCTLYAHFRGARRLTLIQRSFNPVIYFLLSNM